MTFCTSASSSVRGSDPATSALLMAVSVIRRVDRASSSRDFMAAVRSSRSRSFRVLTGRHGSRRGSAGRAGSTYSDAVHSWARIALAATTTGAAGVAYAAGYERRHYTLREATLPVLEAGARPVRVLHVSDLHMTPGQTAKQRWVADLARLEPDLVVNTGDNLAHQRAVPAVMSAL